MPFQVSSVFQAFFPCPVSCLCCKSEDILCLSMLTVRGKCNNAMNVIIKCDVQRYCSASYLLWLTSLVVNLHSCWHIIGISEVCYRNNLASWNHLPRLLECSIAVSVWGMWEPNGGTWITFREAFYHLNQLHLGKHFQGPGTEAHFQLRDGEGSVKVPCWKVCKDVRGEAARPGDVFGQRGFIL